MTQTSMESPTSSGWHVRPGRVLVVDDEPLLLVTIRHMLAEEFQVVTASSGVDALQVLREGIPFDAILSDLVMPGMTGLALLDAIGREFPEQTTAVMFMSGGIVGPLGARVAARGLPWLPKPFHTEELRTAVRARVDQLRRERGLLTAEAAGEVQR
jgi:CheY-like chemotaxis protein